MKAQSTARLTFLNPRVLIGFALYTAGLVLAFAPMSSATAGDNAAAELNQQWIKAHLLRGGFYLLLALAGTLVALFRLEARVNISHRALTSSLSAND